MNTLNDRGVKGLKPKAKSYKISDGGTLFLLVTPSGGKLWRMAYRFDGKQKTLALGSYPEVPLSDARAKRDEARARLAKGIDPSAEKQAQKITESGADSFEAIAREWLAVKRTKWAASNYSRIVSRMERDVFPILGKRPLKDITTTEIKAVLDAVESRGAIESAHRVQQYIRQVFTFAMVTERCDSNPALNLQTLLSTPQKNHMAAITDPLELGHALRAFDEYRGTLPVKAALRLLPMLFLRSGEMRGLRWDNVDMEAAEIRFTASKTGAEMITPLPRQGLAILKELKPFTEPHCWVFAGPRPSKPISENATLSAMRGCGITKDKASNHGFRATARTLLDERLGFPIAHIEMQLGHAVRDVHGRAYNRTQYLKERAHMMQAWADYLDELKLKAVNLCL